LDDEETRRFDRVAALAREPELRENVNMVIMIRVNMASLPLVESLQIERALKSSVSTDAFEPRGLNFRMERDGSQAAFRPFWRE
jgi:hypothetical protein